jgi:hypothetical protein
LFCFRSWLPGWHPVFRTDRRMARPVIGAKPWGKLCEIAPGCGFLEPQQSLKTAIQTFRHHSCCTCVPRGFALLQSHLCRFACSACFAVPFPGLLPAQSFQFAKCQRNHPRSAEREHSGSIRGPGLGTAKHAEHAKTALLMVLQRPETPLRTNGSENDIRCRGQPA